VNDICVVTIWCDVIACTEEDVKTRKCSIVQSANGNGYATLADQVYAQDYALGAAHRM
jgi:hypothetical protein